MLIVLIGGVMQGSFALPMKFARRWAWENIWLVYSLVGLALIPWLAAFLLVPGLSAIYAATPLRVVALTGLFGFGWGFANVLFGVAVSVIGMALTFAIVVGMSAALGSLIPLVLLSPARLMQPSGLMVMLGLALTLIGVAILGVAGWGREKASGRTSGQQPLALGLALCIIAGLLAPMLNFSFAFGSPIVEQAVRRGVADGPATSALWAFALSAGFLSNGGYCVWKLRRNGTWANFGLNGAGAHWILAASMGILWTGGLLLYGRGATLLGDLGAAIGWPVFQATIIIVSSLLGAVSGEWRGAEPRFKRLNNVGLVILLGAILVLSIGNRM